MHCISKKGKIIALGKYYYLQKLKELFSVGIEKGSKSKLWTFMISKFFNINGIEVDELDAIFFKLNFVQTSFSMRNNPFYHATTVFWV